MARRQLLTEEERRSLFGLPMDRDALARHYTFTRTDLDLVATRRGDANHLALVHKLMIPIEVGHAFRREAGHCSGLFATLGTQA